MNRNTKRRHRLWLAACRNGQPRCYWCKRPLAFKDATVEHLLARSRGGTNKPSNLALACRQCNHGRKDGWASRIFKPE